MLALAELPLPCLNFPCHLLLLGLAVTAISLTDQMSVANLFYFCYLRMVQPQTAIISQNEVFSTLV